MSGNKHVKDPATPPPPTLVESLHFTPDTKNELKPTAFQTPIKNRSPVDHLLRAPVKYDSFDDDRQEVERELLRTPHEAPRTHSITPVRLFGDDESPPAKRPHY